MTQPLEVPEYRQRRSHSQLTNYEACPRQYFHLKVQDHPKGGAWWYVGGTAIHGAIEDAEMEGLDVTGAVERFYVHFAEGIIRQVEEAGTPEHWRAANKGTEDGVWWNDNGPAMIHNYFETRIPGRILIGTELKFMLDVEGVLFTGFIDQVWTTMADHFEVDDLKSGRKCPTNVRQLAQYAWAIEKGALSYALASEPVAMLAYNHVRTGKRKAWYGGEWQDFYPWARFVEEVHTMDRLEKSGAYPPRPSFMCGFCPVWDLCQGIGMSVEGFSPL